MGAGTVSAHLTDLSLGHPSAPLRGGREHDDGIKPCVSVPPRRAARGSAPSQRATAAFAAWQRRVGAVVARGSESIRMRGNPDQ
jgi:hypothetical protein